MKKLVEFLRNNIQIDKSIILYTIISIVVGIIFLVVELDIIIWSKLLAIAVIAQLISVIFLFKIKNKKLFSFSTIFILISYIFHMGLLILKLVNYENTIADLTIYIPYDTYTQSYIYSFLVLTLLTSGIYIFTKKHEKSLEIETFLDKKFNEKNYMIVALIILTISLPLRLYVDISKLIVSFTSGYLEVFDLNISGIVYQIANFYYLGIFILLIASRNNKLYSRIILIIASIYGLVTLLSGSRGITMIFLAVIYFFYFKINEKINFKKIMILASLGVSVILLYTTLSVTRLNGFDFKILLQTLLDSTNNPLFKILEEFGLTQQTVALTMQADFSWGYGKTYIYGLSQMFVNIFGILDNATTNSIYANFINSQVPIGGSYIGELYFNFGWFGLILVPMFGGVIAAISLKVEKMIKYKNYIKLGVLFLVIASLLWYVRDYFSGMVRQITWGILFIYCISYGYSYWLKKKEKKSRGKQ